GCPGSAGLPDHEKRSGASVNPAGYEVLQGRRSQQEVVTTKRGRQNKELLAQTKRLLIASSRRDAVSRLTLSATMVEQSQTILLRGQVRISRSTRLPHGRLPLLTSGQDARSFPGFARRAASGGCPWRFTPPSNHRAPVAAPASDLAWANL